MFFFLLYSYLDSLKWVILIGSFIYFFKPQIQGILSRSFSISKNGTTVNFPLTQQTGEDDRNDNKEIKKIENKSEAEIEEIKNNLEKKESEIHNKDQQIFKLTIEKHFEYTYRIIFRSQIQLLQNLQAISDGFSIIQLENHFQTVKNSFVALSTWNIDLYLKFLYDQNLIIKDGVTGKIKITAIGDLFLKYLIISGYNFNNEKNL
jgi:hypothetical protein